MENSENYKKLEQALVGAYHQKESAEPDDFWEMRVMSHIRSLGPLNSEPGYFIIFDQFVWRFAAAACVLVLILSLYAFQTGIQPEYELANLFMDDSAELTFVEYFGI